MFSHHFEGQEIDDELKDEDGILNLKTNTIPKGMVELEHIFDHDESTLNKRVTQEKRIEECDCITWVLMKKQKWYR